MRRIIILIFALLILRPVWGFDEAFVVDSLRKELAKVHTPADSLHIYYDLFDLSHIKNRGTIAKELYDIARRAHNLTAQLDMLRMMGNIAESEKKDSVLVRCEELVQQMPDGEAQRETLAFLAMKRVALQSQSINDSLRDDYLRHELERYPGDSKSSLVEQIKHHYTVCLFLGGRLRSSLLTENIEHLGELIEQMPENSDGVRNTYYTQIARMYTALGDHERAIAADREMVNIIKTLEERYHKQGRKFRKYNIYYYNVYRRMLVNYKGLHPGEADSIYSKIEKLAADEIDVANDMKSNRRSEIFYLMAKERYSEAIPLIRDYLDAKGNRSYRMTLLRELITAAQATGDKESLLFAMPLYIEALEKQYSHENLSDLINKEVEYKMIEYGRTKDELNSEIQARKEAQHRNTVIVSVVATVVLVAFILLLLTLYRRTKRLAANLEKSNRELREERDKLRRSEADLRVASERANEASVLKEDFINNISREVKVPLDSIVEYSQLIVDNMDTEQKKYLQSFADVITLSAELITTLIDDMLNASSYGKGEVDVNSRPVDIKSICNMALANVKKDLAPGVELVFEERNEGSSIITTDAQRVDQVLLQLLRNAAKFTEEGSITLSYSFDDERNNISFAVTDTGIGIPEGKEDVVFRRFEKLDNHAKGLGLGLYISSMIARLLHGTLKVDTGYRDGARFVFTIPTK